MSENYSIVTDVNAGSSLSVLDSIIAKITQVESAVGKASGQKLQIDTGNSSNLLSGLSSRLSGSKGNFANVGRELGQSLTMGMTQQFGMAGGVASSFAGALGPVGLAAGVAGAALIGLGAASTQAAAQWEDMKTSIGRTTGLKGDNLESLMDSLQDLRQEFGVTAQAASSMVEQAGSIGVGQSKLAAGNISGYKQEILDFTKATTLLQGAWGMSAEATSSGIGKMGSVTLGAWNIQRKARGEEELSWADYAYKVGGTVDNLANAMGSSEEEIVTAMRNSSGAIAKWAPSEDTYGKWQAMASFLIDTGDSAGEAGTKIERVSQKMEQNSADVAALMGIDDATLQSKLKTDFMGTVQDLGKSIASMPASQRPDLFKMFGLEGASLMGKVIADIEAGTGKLQSAFDLALSPGNVEAGYEDVADNASKAFDRIGQAAQVSLEKIGGQLLPIVSDIANSVADVWIAANEKGAELFSDFQKNAEESKTIDVQNVGDFVKASAIALGLAEPEQATNEISAQEMAKQTTDVYTDYVNAGIQAANFDPVTGKMAEVGATAGDTFGDGFLKAIEESKVSAELGALIYDAAGNIQMSDEAARAILSSQSHTSTYLKPGTKSDFATLLASYSAQHFSGESIASSGFWNVFDDSGKIVAEKVLDIEAWKEQMQPIVLDLPKYFDTAGAGIKSSLMSAIEDGVIEPLTEKPLLEGLVKQLDEMEKQHPIEFEAANLGELRQDIEDSLAGIKLDLDTGEIETNFGIWLSERMDMYQAIYELTEKHGAPVMSYESQQRSFWDKLMASSDPDRMNQLVGYIEKAASSSATFQDIEILPAILEEIAAKEPQLLEEQAMTNMLIAAQERYGDQVQYNGQTFTVLDENGKALAVTHLRTAQYGNIAYGGLTKLADSLSPAAKSVDDLASAAKSAASALMGIHYGGVSSYSPSYASTGKGLGTTYYSGANLNAAATVKSLASNYINSSDFNGLLMNIPKLAGGGMVTGEGLVWAGENGRELVIPVNEISGLWSDSVATAAKGSIGWYLNDQWFQDLAPTITSAASYQWSKFPNAPAVMESNTDAIQRAWLSEDQKSTKDVYSGLVRQTQLASIGNSLVQPYYTTGKSNQPDWWIQAATSVSPNYDWSGAKGGNIEDLVSGNSKTATLEATATKAATTIADIWNSIYGESFTEGCIATATPDPSLIYTPSTKAVSDYAYKQAEDDAIAWSHLYGESFTEGCIATINPDSTLKYTASEKIKNEAARVLGGSWGSESISDLFSAGGSEKVYSVLSNIDENTEGTTSAISDLKTTMSSTIFSSGSTMTNGGIFSSLSGANLGSVATTGTGELVTGLSKEGYVVTYDPRTDTCEGLAFNAPDPSLKTTDRFYLGITSGKLAAESYDQGYGWGGRVGWTDDKSLQAEQVTALASLQQQSSESGTRTVSGIQSMVSNGQDMLSVSRQILASSQDANAIALANTIVSTYGSTGGGSSGYGALVSGGGGSDWFSAAASRYGSTFNDWISGGAAGVGTGSDPDWFTEALANALGSGYIGSVVGNRSSTVYNTGQYTANQVESSGGSYGGWVPAFANEAFIPSATLAVVGDRPGGEYVIGADRFESAVAKIGSSPNITINSPITVQGNGNSDELDAVLERRNRDLMEDITEAIANAARGL